MEQATGFRKIWEVGNLFHCSIIGTCLTIDETLGVFKKAGLIVPPEARDYEIHAAAVKCAGELSAVSRRLQGALDARFRRHIALFATATDAEGVAELWDEHVAKGDIPGAYWAVMTHRASSTALIERAFGEVHMMSHLNGSSRRDVLRELENAKGEIARLSESKNHYRRQARLCEAEVKLAGQARTAVKSLTRELDAAKARIDALEGREEAVKLREEIVGLSNMMEAERYRRERAEVRCAELSADNAALSGENDRLAGELQAARGELFAMEGALATALEKATGSCTGCGNDECECRKLVGKRVMYVGGHRSVVSRCREVVELFGGDFIHHDGGVEESASHLPASLKRADVVFCPLDCVSHNAALVVKKACSRYRKPLVFLKSSGLSGFIRGIDDMSRARELGVPAGMVC